MIVWPSQLPIDGDPPEMLVRTERWNDWLKTSKIPKLALWARPSLFMPNIAVDAMAEMFPNLTTCNIGEGLHFVQESQPDAIAREIAAWLQGID